MNLRESFAPKNIKQTAGRVGLSAVAVVGGLASIDDVNAIGGTKIVCDTTKIAPFITTKVEDCPPGVAFRIIPPKESEKRGITDVEFVKDLLGKYLDLDVIPQLNRIKDIKYESLLRDELTKSLYDSRDTSSDYHPKSLPIGKFELPSSYEQIEYTIPSANLTIGLAKISNGGVLTSIGFPMDEDGNIVLREDPRLWTLKPVPTKEQLDKLVSSGTATFTRLLRHKPQPNAWSVDNSGFPRALRIMNSNVVSPDGVNIRYSVGGTGEQPLSVFVLVRQ